MYIKPKYRIYYIHILNRNMNMIYLMWTLILWMRKWGLREIKLLAQSHIAQWVAKLRFNPEPLLYPSFISSVLWSRWWGRQKQTTQLVLQSSGLLLSPSHSTSSQQEQFSPLLFKGKKPLYWSMIDCWVGFMGGHLSPISVTSGVASCIFPDIQ